ncbi:response regulator [bacterium]|nr:response regulator [bacterium]NBX97919.1 response regulator [bacterium]NDC94311.1 response regulator [bacterium]NDD82789.1 response regulator [bacterium]NDG28837.1 response regulator [bacterium]
MAKIMLVEDDNNLREIYEARLLAEGYEIVTARDGEEALAIAVKERPDLVISDVMMPKISGFDMLDILRSTPETKNVKVIMMTALSQVEDKERAEKLGADRYLVKSQVTLEDVARVAREVLELDQPTTSTPAPAVNAAPIAPVVDAPLPTAVPVATTEQPAVVAPPAPTVNEQAATTTSTQPNPITVTDINDQVPSIDSTTTAEPPQLDASGITDLSSQNIPASEVEKATLPETQTTQEVPGDNEIIQPSAKSWNLETQATDTNEQQVGVSSEQASSVDAIAAAEEKVNSVDTVSIEDEETAIAKQIETMIGKTTPTESTTTQNQGTPTTLANTGSVVAAESAVSSAQQATPPTEHTVPPEQSASATSPTSTEGQKVIQPLTNATQPTGPDIHELAAKEDAITAVHSSGSVITPTEVGDTTAENKVESKPAGIDPNSLAL